jgi:hypothetical protein
MTLGTSKCFHSFSIDLPTYLPTLVIDLLDVTLLPIANLGGVGGG